MESVFIVPEKAQFSADAAQHILIARVIAFICPHQLVHIAAQKRIDSVFGSIAHHAFQLFQRTLGKAAREVCHNQKLKWLSVFSSRLIILQDIGILAAQIILIDGLCTVQQDIQALFNPRSLYPDMGIHQTLIHICEPHEGCKRITGIAGTDEGKPDLAGRVRHKQLHSDCIQI